MTNFFRAGGWTIWMVLLCATILLIAAGSYALRPKPKKLALVRALTMAVLFASLGGLCTNVMAVMNKVTGIPEWAQSPDMPLIVMSGIGESLTCPVLGFMSLTLAWLFVVVGTRRRDDLDLDT